MSREVHAPFCEQHLGRLRVLTLPINTLAVMVKTGFDMDVVEDICFYFEVAVPPSLRGYIMRSKVLPCFIVDWKKANLYFHAINMVILKSAKTI